MATLPTLPARTPLGTSLFYGAMDPFGGGDDAKFTGEQLKTLVNGANTYLIETEADFPVQDATTITLGTGVYNINAVIVTSKRFIVANGSSVIFRGGDAFVHGIVYTGSGDMYTGTDFIDLSFVEVFASCPSGTLFEIQPVSAEASQVFMVSSAFVSIAALGTCKNIDAFVFTLCAFQDVGTGITLDTVRLISGFDTQLNGWQNASTTMISVQGTMKEFLLAGVTTEPKSNESVFDFDSALVIQTGSITGCPVSFANGGSVFAAGSKDQDDIQFKYIGNVNIVDSMATVGISLTDNATSTSFSAVDTPALVAGTWSTDGVRFTTTAAGRARYDGLEQVSVFAFSNPTAVLAVGTNKDVSFYFSQGNDTLNTITAVADQGGGVIRVTTGNPHGLTTGDRVPQTNTTSYNDTYTVTVIDTTNYDITETFVATETGNWQLILEKSKAENQLSSSTKASSTTIGFRTSLVTNDFIEVFTENNTDGTGVLVKDTNLII